MPQTSNLLSGRHKHLDDLSLTSGAATALSSMMPSSSAMRSGDSLACHQAAHAVLMHVFAQKPLLAYHGICLADIVGLSVPADSLLHLWNQHNLCLETAHLTEMHSASLSN